MVLYIQNGFVARNSTLTRIFYYKLAVVLFIFMVIQIHTHCLVIEINFRNKKLNNKKYHSLYHHIVNIQSIKNSLMKFNKNEL